MKSSKTILTLTAAASLIAVASVSAQTVIYDFDYDSTIPSGGRSGFGFTSAAYSVTADGVGGTGGGNALFDSTGQSGGMAFGITISNGRNGVLADSTNAAEYKLTFDAKAIGLLSGQSMTGNVELQFNFGPKATANGGNAVTITDTFQTFEFNLGSDFNAVPTIALSDLNNSMQLKVEDGSAHTHFGFDTANSIILDNVQLVQIPESSTFAALAGALALSMVMVRRRRS